MMSDYKIISKTVNHTKCYFILVPVGYKGKYKFLMNHFYDTKEKAIFVAERVLKGK